jgi:ribA/ribD-fused uncharacterized protein
MIPEFQGSYRWLSNFWVCPIEFGGINYPSVEHAYQAAKCADVWDRHKILHAKTPGDAKRIGRKSKIRDDWDVVKLDVMLDLLRKKFSIPDLRKKLFDTGNLVLQEGNWWGDKFWGVDLRTNAGENHLGKLLMRVRDERS